MLKTYLVQKTETDACKSLVVSCIIFTDTSWKLTIARVPSAQKPNPTTYEMSVKILHLRKMIKS